MERGRTGIGVEVWRGRLPYPQAIALTVITVACASQPSPTPPGTFSRREELPQGLASPATEVPEACRDSSKVRFTYDLIQKYNLTADDLKKLQFYSAAPFTLSRVLKSEERSTAKHALITREGVLFEEVEVPCLTRGRIVTLRSNLRSNDALGVSFEKDSGGIEFVNCTEGLLREYNLPYLGDEFRIYNGGPIHTTTFEKSTYDLRGNSYLLIDRQQEDSFDKQKRTLRGYDFDGGA